MNTPNYFDGLELGVEEGDTDLYYKDPVTKTACEIPKYMKTIKKLLNRSNVLFGASYSGKSIITLDMMKIMQYCFPWVFIFNPTEKENRTFTGHVPPQLIFTKVNAEDLISIYQRQKMATSVYKKANNIKVLNALFNRIAPFKIRQMRAQIIKVRDIAKSRIEEKYKNAPADRKKETDRIMAIANEKLVKFFKIIIRHKFNQLKTMNLTKDEKYSLKYINFNPRVLIVFDDCAVQIKKLSKNKKTKTILDDFFFFGRWQNITTIYTFQDIKFLPSELCKNSFNTVFCTESAANSYYGRAANNFTAADKKRVGAMAAVVFSEKNQADYKKLIYCRTETPQYQYIIGTQHETFRMCSKHVWDYCEKVAEDGEDLDVNNPFFNRFAAVAES